VFSKQLNYKEIDYRYWQKPPRQYARGNHNENDTPNNNSQHNPIEFEVINHTSFTFLAIQASANRSKGIPRHRFL
jgi:hypothetical protein